jgi:hypothetical protein
MKGEQHLFLFSLELETHDDRKKNEKPTQAIPNLFLIQLFKMQLVSWSKK